MLIVINANIVLIVISFGSSDEEIANVGLLGGLVLCGI